MARIKVQNSHIAVYRPMQLHVETCWENAVANWSQCWEEQHQTGSCSVVANVFTGRAHTLISHIFVNRPQRKTLKQMTLYPNSFQYTLTLMKDRQRFGNLKNQYPSTFTGRCSDAFSFASSEQSPSILPENAASEETTPSSVWLSRTLVLR